MTPALRILLMMAGAAVVLWGMGMYAAYINSALLAVMIVLAFGPLIDWLRPRTPRWATLLIALAASLVALVLFLTFLIYAGAQFALSLPDYKQQASELVQQVQAWLQGLGLATAGAGALAAQADPTSSLYWVAGLLDSIVAALGSGVTLAMIMIFLFVDVILFPGRLAWQGLHRSSYAQRVASFTGDLRQYIVVMVIIGAAVGAANTVFFIVTGVPMPLLWGVLSGLLNFIPFIGFWFGLIPPALLALLDQGPGRMLLVAAGYLLINAAVQNVIQPKLVVSRLNLTPFMSLFSATFWPLVLGPVGAIIGVPLTMAVRSLLLDADPATRWLADLMSTTIPMQETAANTTLPPVAKVESERNNA